MLNMHADTEWSPYNSLIVDDQVSNGRLQPESIMKCPLFTNKSPDDDFLLAFIGVLDELAPETNFAAAMKQHKFNRGIALEDWNRYSQRGTEVCRKYDIKVSRGTPYHDPGSPFSLLLSLPSFTDILLRQLSSKMSKLCQSKRVKHQFTTLQLNPAYWIQERSNTVDQFLNGSRKECLFHLRLRT